MNKGQSRKRRYNKTAPKKYSRPIIKRYKPNVYNKYSAKKKSQEIKTVDMTFSGGYNNGVYAPDQLNNPVIMINSTGTIQNLACIQQGSGVSQRIGNKVALKSLRIRLALSDLQHNYDVISENRIMIVYDRQPNGTYPTINNMLQLIKQDGSTAHGNEVSNINVSQLDRYVVLMDKLISLPPYESGAFNTTSMVGVTQQSSYIIDEFIKLKRLETCFSTTSNPCTIATIQTGALYVISLGDAVATGEPYCWVGNMRLRFYDN